MSYYRRVIIPRYGGPEVLQLIEEPIPTPGPHEVLVRVLVSGVSHGDIMIRKGMLTSPMKRLPFTPGHEVVGIVTSVGHSVTHVMEGQRVAALIFQGGNAEYVCLDERLILPVPEQLDSEEVACLILNYLTAYQLLHALRTYSKASASSFMELRAVWVQRCFS